MKIKTSRGWLRAVLCGISLSVVMCVSTGCQVTVGGQLLPSPYYINDDVQYFPAGSEFPLSREAAAQKAYKADQELQGR